MKQPGCSLKCNFNLQFYVANLWTNLFHVLTCIKSKCSYQLGGPIQLVLHAAFNPYVLTTRLANDIIGELAFARSLVFPAIVIIFVLDAFD
jgi:hypothetical protein